MNKFLSALLAMMMISFTANATIIHVPGDYQTIQAGIGAAVDDDIVLVADGTYIGTGNKDIDFTGKAIEVMSENGPEVTIIDCNGSASDPHRGFYFHSGENSTSILSGFKIINGYATGNYPLNSGGGIYCYDSSPVIQNCIISGNSAWLYGGGIYCANSSPVIQNCIISGNSAAYGGGINCSYYSSPVIENCTLRGNSTDYVGGGIYCQLNSSPVIENCTISGNSADYGGGINCSYYSSPVIENCTVSGNSVNWVGGGIYCEFNSNPVIENCTISGNSATYGGGIYCNDSSPVIENCTISENPAVNGGGGIYCESNSSPTGVNIIIWANSAPTGSQIYFSSSSFFYCTYSDIQDGWPGTGNINLNPDFVDPSNEDYHLQPSSPCIDAGNPDPQYNDPEDPANPGFALYPAMGTIVNDMGAYGGQGAAGWVGVSERLFSEQHPKSYSLFQNYPNPFNPETTIAFELQKSGEISLIIYDIQGRVVAKLVDGWLSAGIHEQRWEAAGMPSGIYFARLVAGDFQQTRKMLLIK